MGFFECVIEDALFVCLLSRIVPYLCWNVISSVYARKKKKVYQLSCYNSFKTNKKHNFKCVSWI